MALDKKTVKIIVIALVAVAVIAVVLGLIFGLALPSNEIELQVWPRGGDGGKEPLILYNLNDAKSYLPWVRRINETLKDYRKKGTGNGEAHCAENRINCHFGNPPTGDKVCDVPVDNFNPCTPVNQYNYEEAAPCVFLKLNNIFNWKPKPYNTTEEDLPKTMPETLKILIKLNAGKPEANMVWVSCEGENPADVENIGPVQYIPSHGFPAYYYPFTNKEGYLSPLVAVLFERPRTNVLISIECKAWAKNIFYDRYERRGSVRFELMVDRG